MERINKKMEELEKVQQFIEESRAVRERIHANFDLSKVTSIGPLVPVIVSEKDLQVSHRSLSHTQEANNIAELRRNIADKYASKKSPKVQKPAVSPPTRSNHQTPSPIREGIVSGVFVSYPRRRSTSAPPSGEDQQPSPVAGGRVLSQFRAQTSAASGKAKMTIEEYAKLRQNLLDHSEQHAVTSDPSRS
jgi:hypothetical protein